MCHFRREIKECTDCAAGGLASAQFQHLAEKHEHGDDGRRLVVDRYKSALSAKARWKDRWCKSRNQAVEIRRTHPERDQTEHVERAAAYGIPATLEERPTGEEHDRRAECELDPQ